MNTKINPNLAEPSELMSLKGIGAKLAQRIIEARPFTSLQDLKRVKGIGSFNLLRWSDSLTLSELEPSVIIENPPAEFSPTPQADLPAEAAPENVPVADEIPPAPPLADFMAIEVEETKPELADAPGNSQPAPQAKYSFDRDQVLIAVGIGSIASLLLSLALILGLIAILNQGRLRFASPAELNTLSLTVNSLTARLDTQENDLLALRARVDTLETLDTRMTAAEESITTLTQDLEGLITQVSSLEDDVSLLNEDVALLQSQTSLFESFFESMRNLFNDFFPMQGDTND